MNIRIVEERAVQLRKGRDTLTRPRVFSAPAPRVFLADSGHGGLTTYKHRHA